MHSSYLFNSLRYYYCHCTTTATVLLLLLLRLLLLVLLLLQLLLLLSYTLSYHILLQASSTTIIITITVTIILYIFLSYPFLSYCNCRLLLHNNQEPSAGSAEAYFDEARPHRKETRVIYRVETVEILCYYYYLLLLLLLLVVVVVLSLLWRGLLDFKKIMLFCRLLVGCIGS